jgi:hypothetical protein
MHLLMRTAFYLAAAFPLVGCTPTFVDSSGKEPYKSKLGNVCTSSVPLHAHGVTATVEREKKTDSILVTELSLSGPEFTFTTTLPSQSTLHLVAAQECSNCVLEAQARFLVTVSPPLAQGGGVPVYIRADAVRSGVLACK